MGRCQTLMSVEAASGGSPDGGGRTHRMQRGLSGAREGAAAAAATLLPARQSAARHRPECCSSCAPQHLRLTQFCHTLAPQEAAGEDVYRHHRQLTWWPRSAVAGTMTRRVCQISIPKYLPLAGHRFSDFYQCLLLFAGGAVRSAGARSDVRLIAWAVGSQRELPRH
ncbi:unnamed protein product [Arctia plantaginis]|uniref:Uncharacterized protein n=1 Tax=Arctia plantaginis TaxID=874455 RepID=A0A8S1ARQ5_ARCPL|nr:unnamed protein product [Arctia plantaginis]